MGSKWKTRTDSLNWGRDYAPIILTKPTLKGKWKWKLRFGVWSCRMYPPPDIAGCDKYIAHLKDGKITMVDKVKNVVYDCGKMSPKGHSDLLHAILFYGQH